MKRIYMVEDNPDNADLVLDLLEDSYEIVHFLDANAALDRLKSIKPEDLPHLFLLDISLPGMASPYCEPCASIQPGNPSQPSP